MDEEQQKKYVEFQTLNSQLQQLQQQIVRMEQQAVELKMLSDGIDDIKKAKKGDEILAPLGSGIFLKTALQENDKVLMNVGSGTVVDKTGEEAKNILEEQQAELKKAVEKMSADFQNGAVRLQQLQKELQQLQKA